MAKNIYSLQLLRNGQVYASKTAAKQALQNAEALADVVKKDGVAVLARYLEPSTGDNKDVKTLVGYYAKADEMTAAGGGASYMTIMDFDSSSVEALEEKVQELQDALGEGFTTANTVADNIEEISDQLAALSGTPSDTSASTSVEGAKKYADEKIAQIDAEYKAADVALKAEILGDASESANTLGKLEDIVNDISSEAKEYSIVKVATGLPETVKERYELHDAAGHVSGDTIDIPKDSHIVSISYITSGEHAQNLEYMYIDASGNTQTTYVDMSELVLETEFASGVTVTDHIAHGVVDPTSEPFLTVGANGFKLSGVQDAIDTAYEGLDATVTGETSDGHITISIEELDGKLVQSGLTISESNIANADDLEELSGKTVTEIGSSNSSISATTSTTANGTVSVDLVTDASKIQMSGFTAAQSGFTSITEASSVTDAFKAVEAFVLDNEEVVSAALNDLEETKAEITYVETVSGDLQTQINSLQSGSTEALDNEIATRKAIEGQSGTTYAPSTSSPYISSATNMTNADELLASALNNVETNMVSGATMNGSAVTKSNESLAFTAVAASGASNSANAIVIDTDANGGLHFSLGTLDAGYYDSQA